LEHHLGAPVKSGEVVFVELRYVFAGKPDGPAARPVQSDDGAGERGLA
jgi:hypothetical protein